VAPSQPSTSIRSRAASSRSVVARVDTRGLRQDRGRGRPPTLPIGRLPPGLPTAPGGGCHRVRHVCREPSSRSPDRWPHTDHQVPQTARNGVARDALATKPTLATTSRPVANPLATRPAHPGGVHPIDEREAVMAIPTTTPGTNASASGPRRQTRIAINRGTARHRPASHGAAQPAVPHSWQGTKPKPTQTAPCRPGSALGALRRLRGST